MAHELAQRPEAEEFPTGAAQAAQSDQELGVEYGDAVKMGLLGGVTAIFIASIGMIEAFSGRMIMQPNLTLSYAALFLVPLVFGYFASKQPDAIEGVTVSDPGPRNVLAGLIAGTLTGVLTAAFVALASAVPVRSVLIAISPRMIEIMTFGQGVVTGGLLLVASAAVVGTLAGTTHLLHERWRTPIYNAITWTLLIGLLDQMVKQVLRGLNLQAVIDFLFDPSGGMHIVGAAVLFGALLVASGLNQRKGFSVSQRYADLEEDDRQKVLLIGVVVLLAVLAILPQIVGVFISEVLDVVGIFLLMGLGLNIVVGFAGLLDLGYVAFFAVGAYVTAVLTSPTSPAISPELTFWTALPFVVLAAAFAGIIVGTPVLRMRGDYLAIVTLGFGEIARILFISEALFPYVGGAQGILSIPKVQIFGFVADSPPTLFYPIAVFVLFAIYVTWALKNSRVGRAWMAMREDEPVAEVMGVNTVEAKLKAFIVGAILASLGGALFATKLGSVFPHTFQILVSITVLVLIIVGGMGSIPGVVVGALVVVGLPEVLREFAEYKFLMYGALLIYMMINKPEGFVPTRERVRELHQEEMMQDAWLAREEADKQGEPAAEAADRTANEGLS